MEEGGRDREDGGVGRGRGEDKENGGRGEKVVKK